MEGVKCKARVAKKTIKSNDYKKLLDRAIEENKPPQFIEALLTLIEEENREVSVKNTSFSAKDHNFMNWYMYQKKRVTERCQEILDFELLRASLTTATSEDQRNDIQNSINARKDRVLQKQHILDPSVLQRQSQPCDFTKVRYGHFFFSLFYSYFALI